MAEAVVLNCEKRDLSTKSYLRSLRKKGKIPAVVYGHQLENLHISLDARRVGKILHTHGLYGIFNLLLENRDQPVTALIREVQRDPISGEINHIDFLRISMEETITATVPVILHGEEAILSKGGILQGGIKEVEVECLPGNLPDVIRQDISHLDIGDKLTVGQLTVPAGVKILTEPEAVVASVLSPAKAEEETPAAEGEGEASPE